MSDKTPNPNDSRLSALLRASRASPPLPPRFQENVWRRIGNAKTAAKAGSWLDALTVLILRPRIAVATAVVLVFAGILLGARSGAHSARLEAQARYLAAVAPNSLR